MPHESTVAHEESPVLSPQESQAHMTFVPRSQRTEETEIAAKRSKTTNGSDVHVPNLFAQTPKQVL